MQATPSTTHPTRGGRVALAGLLLLLVLAGTTGVRPVGAAPIEVYNTPPGGGPITEVTERVGPIHLDALGGPHDIDEANKGVPRPPGAFGIKTMTFDLVDANGVPYNMMDVMLHHFVIAKLFTVDNVCPGRVESGVAVSPFAGTGMERTPLAFPDPYTLLVGEKEGWGATWHVMNLTAAPKDVYIQYKIGIQPGANASNSRSLVPYFADVTGCGGSVAYDIPGNGGPGSTSSRSTTFTVPKDGIMVGTGGHLHEGGINTVLKHGDGSLICNSVANYDWMNMLSTITPCQTHDTVAAGETIELTATYDNSQPYHDVMGINLSFIWFGDQGTPPPTTTTTTTATPTTTTTTADAVVAAATAVPATAVTATPSLAG